MAPPSRLSQPQADDEELEAYSMRSNLLSTIDEHDEDGPAYYDSASPRGGSASKLPNAAWRILMGSKRRKNESNYSDSARTSVKLDTTSPLFVKRRWSQAIAHFLRRAVVLGPAIVLMFFGLIHVLQVLIGRASFFWDESHDNDFLPEWGMPGKIGENLAHYPTDATRDVLPIACHSHNDYWRRIPLFEAIHYGCTGVEADVWAFDDDLYVGHSQSALSRNRTFRSMYVDPLVELLDRQNPKTEFADVPSPKHGVFDVDAEQTLVLLVDFKTDGYETWPYIESQLSALRDKNYLTYWNGSETVYGAVTVLGTGNTPYDKIVANQTYRDIFFDAPLDKLWEMPRKTEKPAVVADAKREVVENTNQGQGKKGVPHEAEFDLSNSYYASVSFTQTVGLVWKGHLSPAQMDIIRGQIRGAKRRGLKARYWGTPEWPISARNHVWHVLMKEGADVLNVDDLKSAARLDWRKWRHDWW